MEEHKGQEAAESEERVGEVINDTYRLERVLGEGGMGVVYEASHARLQRRFALKLLGGSYNKQSKVVRRFQREAEVTSALGHPNIIDVIDFDRSADGAPFIVMELLEGEDLEAYLAREGPLDAQRALAIFEPVASALIAAHRADIVHRDLKPSNIFLCRGGDDDAEPRVKVLDFGISKVVSAASTLTQTSAVLGTPGYMAPEQASGENDEVDARADVFALGTILYETLGGKNPFAGGSLPRTLFRTVYETPPPLRELRPELGEAISAVVERAMCKALDERVQSVEELLQMARAAVLRGEMPAAAQPALEGAPSNQQGGHLTAAQTPRAIDRAAYAATEAQASSDRSGAHVASDERLGVSAAPTAPTAPAARRNTVRAAWAVAALGAIAGLGFWIRGGAQSAAPSAATMARGGAQRAALEAGATALDGASSPSAATPPPAARSSHVPSSAAASSASAHTKADAATADAEPTYVTLSLRGSPRGARVLDAKGKRLCALPGRIRRPRGEARITLRVVKPGYKTKRLRVDLTRDRTLRVALERAPRAPAVGKPSKRIPDNPYSD